MEIIAEIEEEERKEQTTSEFSSMVSFVWKKMQEKGGKWTNNTSFATRNGDFLTWAANVQLAKDQIGKF